MIKKRNQIIIGIVLVFLMIGTYFYYNDLKRKQHMIRFNGELYTVEEISEKFPQNYDTPAKNTPMEVYGEFRKAIMIGSVDNAFEFMTEKAQKEYGEDLRDAKELKDYQEYLPSVEDLIEDKTDRNFSYWDFYVQNNENVDDGYYSLDLEKNIKGYWEVDSF